MHRCSFPDGYTIKPDGIHDLEPCRYEELERYRNVTISVRRCKVCGNVDLAWYHQDNTEEVDLE